MRTSIEAGALALLLLAAAPPARAMCAKGDKADRKGAAAENAKGMALYHAKRFEEAATTFSHAAELDCDYWLALTNEAASWSRLGKYTNARVALEMAYDRNQDATLQKLASDADYRGLLRSEEFKSAPIAKVLQTELAARAAGPVVAKLKALGAKLAPEAPVEQLMEREEGEPDLPQGALWGECRAVNPPCEECESIPPGAYGVLRLREKGGGAAVPLDFYGCWPSGTSEPLLADHVGGHVYYQLDGRAGEADFRTGRLLAAAAPADLMFETAGGPFILVSGSEGCYVALHEWRPDTNAVKELGVTRVAEECGPAIEAVARAFGRARPKVH